jgi:hypothetical protein
VYLHILRTDNSVKLNHLGAVKRETWHPWVREVRTIGIETLPGMKTEMCKGAETATTTIPVKVGPAAGARAEGVAIPETYSSGLETLTQTAATLLLQVGHRALIHYLLSQRPSLALHRSVNVQHQTGVGADLEIYMTAGLWFPFFKLGLREENRSMRRCE